MSEDQSTKRRGAQFLQLVAASLLGGLLALAATEVDSLVRGTANAADTEPVRTFAGPELSEEWKWKPNPVKYERMYRKSDRPAHKNWIRGSGR